VDPSNLLFGGSIAGRGMNARTQQTLITALLFGVIVGIEPTAGIADEPSRGKASATVTPPGMQAVAPYHELSNSDLLSLFMQLNVQDPSLSPEHQSKLNDLLKEIRDRKLEGELRRRQQFPANQNTGTGSRRP
jgi:hypothetical protein